MHGGVRYLAQGHISLVREALRERSAILANAPHLAQPLAFVVPGYRWWELPFYGAGLKAYEWLAGARSLGATQTMLPGATRQALPTVRASGLLGGIRYWDGQFDDARLAVVLARTAQRSGATVLNRLPVTALRHAGGRVTGVIAHDAETDEHFEISAGCVVNATGVWVDRLRGPTRQGDGRPLVTPSQGVHLVVDRAFLPGSTALMVPKTADGRVLFAVPWLGKTLLGTTDTPRGDIVAEPRPLAHEVDFILGEAARYLSRAPRRSDVRSAWVGLRPLVRPAEPEAQAGAGAGTRSLSREHTVEVGPEGLVTVTGGKWTTYRAMAEDVLATCMAHGLLPSRPGGTTERLPLVGAQGEGGRVKGRPLSEPEGEHLYGSEATLLHTLPGAQRWPRSWPRNWDPPLRRRPQLPPSRRWPRSTPRCRDESTTPAPHVIVLRLDRYRCSLHAPLCALSRRMHPSECTLQGSAARASRTSRTDSTSLSTRGAAPPGACSRYTGTPLRPNCARAWVMAGSRRVQSARSSSTRLVLKSAITSASASVVRLLNWQVTHHAAVKSTKTGRPLASAACTRSADQGCQPSASMTPEVPIP